MDNPSYVTLTRQSGLLKEMQLVANNIANVSTTGFRREGTVFSEVLDRLDVEGGTLAQTAARVRTTDFQQGGLRATGGALDFAIEGEGFFMVETAEGQALTRAGSFALNAEGEVVTYAGERVLDIGGAPLFFPADAAKIEVATDGTVVADGQPIGQFGVVTVDDLTQLTRKGGTLFETELELVPAENATLFQGFVEQSNVDPIVEIARMIEVQRAYEMGQSFLENEDERIRQVVRTIGSAS
ncbi:MAG: flagellar hook-basal body complex protein [Pseudomonadota bacterium]